MSHERQEDRALRATKAMCYHCFDVLVDELREKNKLNGAFSGNWNPFRSTKPLVPEFASELPDSTVQCPLFVTWDKRRSSERGFPCNLLGGRDVPVEDEVLYDLRGCIGSLSPKPLLTGVGEYALTSALRDRRFNPITVQEMPLLRVAVSLLVDYEDCSHSLDWIVGTHGILIRFWIQGREYSATYLPEVAQEQNWDQTAAVTSLIRKAGYSGNLDQGILQQVQCTRYQSSKLRMTFEEYMVHRQ